MIQSELQEIAVVSGDGVCFKKKKEKRKRQKLLLELFYEYAKNSTLHGFRYIVDQKITILERLFWFVTVIGSILICLFYIYNVIIKWKTSPVFVTMNERLASVESVPFPSVTICPQYKVDPNIFNYTEKLFQVNNQSIEEEDFIKFRHIYFLCDTTAFTIRNHPNFSDSDHWNESAVADIFEVAQENYDVFSYCLWKDDYCHDFFTRTLTEDGVCYTANNLASDDIFENTVQQEYRYMESKKKQKGWSLENGYNNSHKTFFPERGSAYNSVPDLSIELKNNLKTSDINCNHVFSGYKIYLHHPADFPLSSLYYYAATPNKESSVAISFNELNSDSSVIKYEAKIRQCYFPDEHKLRYFKIYTANNCHAECISNYTYKLCNCVAFYMPHDNANEICNFYNSQKFCVSQAKKVMIANESNDQIPDEDKCRCLPACNTVEYDADILITDYDSNNYHKEFNDFIGLDIYDLSIKYSRVNLFYKKPQFVTMQRRELFGITDLLANIGGLLGVFLGFSFLSLIELIYFLSVRVGFILKRDQEEKKDKSVASGLKIH